MRAQKFMLAIQKNFKYLPPNLSSMSIDQVDTHNWRSVETWTECPQALKKLSKACSTIISDEWDDLLSTTNPVESINRQSIPENVKSI